MPAMLPRGGKAMTLTEPKALAAALGGVAIE